MSQKGNCPRTNAALQVIPNASTRAPVHLWKAVDVQRGGPPALEFVDVRKRHSVGLSRANAAVCRRG